jgi:hypothetical protein
MASRRFQSKKNGLSFAVLTMLVHSIATNLLLLLCWLTSSSPTTHAWTTGSIVSSFGGTVLITGRPDNTASQHNEAHRTTNHITMKKGKPNIPVQMRTQYKQQQELAAMREQMTAANQPGVDGLPIFNLFVRTKTGARVSFILSSLLSLLFFVVVVMVGCVGCVGWMCSRHDCVVVCRSHQKMLLLLLI